jgi:hypothetical protein
MAKAETEPTSNEPEIADKHTEKQGAEQEYYFDDLHVGVKAKSQKEAREKAEKLAGKESE